MTQAQHSYQSPFAQRYSSPQMLVLFSSQYRYQSWRQLWVALAKAEKDLGLSITDEQIAEMEANLTNIDFARASEFERESRHEVMAHISAFGELCPNAKPIIHLGATSCYVMDNGEILQMRDAMHLVRNKMVQLIQQLSDFALAYKDLPCLGFTHFQPAQLTTVGKRSCLWLQDFLMDMRDLEHRVENLRFLGVKGATGTQASFLSLFDGDRAKVKALDLAVAKGLGFDGLFTIAGQTYTRKQDAQILDVLAGIATSAHKFATDLRLLSHLREVEEPWGKKQVGSSAMAYKRNPMRSERVCAIARFLISLAENPKYTAATQWMERTLDDSANRRLCLSEAFLACDSILNLLIDLTKGLEVHQAVIARRVQEELPFLATENLLMEAVKRGGDRQGLHECIRQHSCDVAERIKSEASDNDLLDRLSADQAFPLDKDEMLALMDESAFVGCAPQQVEEFLEGEVRPFLADYQHCPTEPVSICV